MARPRVYLLYTGGTIGCAGSPLAPLGAKDFTQLVSKQPGFTSQTPSSLVLDVNVNDEEDATIDILVDAIEPAIDSSSMTPKEWVQISMRILDNYNSNDCTGIVVLHGTDTMAFTSSAVSYLLGEGIHKPVVFTGSQVPLSKTRNDALKNLVSAITVAATQAEKLREVILVFDSVILQGNRAVKTSSSAFSAFHSPNQPSLGKIGIETTVNKIMLNRSISAQETLNTSQAIEKHKKYLTQVEERLDTFSVITIMLHPGIQTSTVNAMIQHTSPPVKGVVLQAFGAGNAPADENLIMALKKAHDENGVVICDITQIVSGGVDLDAYESASGLKHAGCISGYDLTPESALAKLVWLTALGYSQAAIEEKMMNPFMDDLTSKVKEQSDLHWEMIEKKRGHSRLVCRLHKKHKKRPASQISTLQTEQ